ncbi:MAG TPA: hypothetical protein EYN66_12795 [Myxococcales bacterium]|nr:hypothetical protein [Myxococcales bacterium]
MLPIIIYGIVAGGGAAVAIGSAYVYENFIDSDPAPIQNYNLNPPPPVNGEGYTYSPSVYAPQTYAPTDGGLLGGLSTPMLAAGAVAGYLLLKN